MTLTTDARGVYYDPYDFQIDADPYSIWKLMRDESPLYYNEKYDFYALSRFEDVERCSKDWRRCIFSPRRIAALEPEVRAFCARSLHPTRERFPTGMWTGSTPSAHIHPPCAARSGCPFA